MTTSEYTQTPKQALSMTAIRKCLLALYGLTSYAVGFGGILAIIFAAGGFIPFGDFLVITKNPIAAVIINIGLTLLFGLQHSIMARPNFKAVFNRLFGQAAERSTFIWTSGVCALVMILCWQPIEGIVWQTQSVVLQTLLWITFVFGWSYLVAATFAINHWDLFGLRQVWLAITDKPYAEPEFKENWLYRMGRHPIMLGILIGVWAIPTMTATHLVLAGTLTVYIFIGVAFEERDLIRHFGQTYLDYKKRVGMFLTLR